MLGWDPAAGAEPLAAERSESCPAQELRAVQTLLWEELTQRILPAERDEVQRAIGSSRIDENQQLYDEASALAEIVGDVRLRTDECARRRQSTLLQTPQREMMENGLRLLLENIQRVATGFSASTSDGPQAAVESLVAKDPKERQMYQYVSTSQPAHGGLGRPATPRTPPSRPMSSCGSRPSTAGTFASNGSLDSAQVIEAVQPKLNAFDIDAVASVLRDALKAEHEALLEDIEYLHHCLEGEAELHSAASLPPPTLNDLTEYSEKLQGTWIKESEKQEHVEKVERMFQASESASEHGSSARRLRAMVGVSRGAEDGGGSQTFRPPSRSASRGSSLLRAGSGASSLGSSDLEHLDNLRLSRSGSLQDPDDILPPVIPPSPRRPHQGFAPSAAAPLQRTASGGASELLDRDLGGAKGLQGAHQGLRSGLRNPGPRSHGGPPQASSPLVSAARPLSSSGRKTPPSRPPLKAGSPGGPRVRLQPHGTNGEGSTGSPHPQQPRPPQQRRSTAADRQEDGGGARGFHR